MTKTLTTPSTMLASLRRAMEELQLYVYLHGSKPKDAPLTGPPKMPSGPYEEAHAQAAAAHKEWAKRFNKTPLEQYEVYRAEDRAMRSEQEADRYRSFVERFVLARAGSLGNLKDGFNAVCDAKAIYKMIDDSAHDYRPRYDDPVPGPIGVTGAFVGPGVTGQQQTRAYAQAGLLGQSAQGSLPDAPSARGGMPPYNLNKGDY